jgi:ketosteroid isomerase-like protein
MRSLGILLALCAACAGHRTPPTPVTVRGPARDSLFALDETRTDSAAAHGIVDAMIGLMSPDAIYLRAGAPAAYGSDAVRALLKATPDTPGIRSSWQPEGGGISDDLRSAYTFGIVARGAADSPIRFERYIAYWRRDAGQSWQIAAYAEINGPLSPEPTVIPEQPPPAQPPLAKPQADARSQVFGADSAFADLGYRMGTAYAFSNSVAPDGVVFGSPQLVIGPRAIQEFFAARGSGTSLSWRPVYAAVAGSRDLGFTVGEYTLTGRGPTGAAVQRFGKYLTVWKRQPNGSWKFAVDGGNGSPAKKTGDE